MFVQPGRSRYQICWTGAPLAYAGSGRDPFSADTSGEA
jgi:hypothetical protein